MRARAFTLAELIVVISVIAMLLGLLLPALGAARAEARTAICQTHIRQLLLEFEQYCQSQDGVLPYGVEFVRWPPPVGGHAGNPNRDPPSWWWFDYLDVVNRTSLRDSGVLLCPAKGLDTPLLAQDVLWGNYGVNQSLCVVIQAASPGRKPSQIPLPRHGIAHPGSTLLLVDSGHALASWALAADEPPEQTDKAITGTPYIPGLTINRTRELEEAVRDDAVLGRHPGKTVNVGFADGHAERKKADDLLVRKTGEDTYDNLSPLWQP